MTRIYANLIGNWVCLNDDPDCIIGSRGQSPEEWWEDNAPVWSPLKRSKEQENSAHSLDHVQIVYKDIEYRICPIYLQIVCS